MTPVALTIAGSDPSGGAGVQSDLRTFTALGVAGLSAITALTVQNSQGVQSVHTVPAAVLAAQLEALFSDTHVHAVKIGMLGGAEQVRAVADALRRHQPPNVILDPVLTSTGGVALLDDAGRLALIEELIPLCDLITPNQAEAAILGTLAAPAILVKGGHLTGSPTDVLTLADGRTQEFSGTRILTPHTHGTGCILSSAIAANLALGVTLVEAITGAKQLITTALQMPAVIGRGRGCPDVMAAVTRLDVLSNPAHQQRIARLRGLYVLTDPGLRPDRSPEEIVTAAVAGGARVIQIRDKRHAQPDLIALSRRLCEIAHAQEALFIVNDSVDVALAANADGVHIGPDDMTPREARRLLGREKLVGVSVSMVDEARAAAPFASYLGIGAIFGSATKGDAGPPVGIERIREIKSACPDHPLIAIGGIQRDNIHDVIQAGADAVAVISAVVCAPDMTEAVRDLVSRLT